MLVAANASANAESKDDEVLSEEVGEATQDDILQIKLALCRPVAIGRRQVWSLLAVQICDRERTT